jgi:hypothetical protein
LGHLTHKQKLWSCSGGGAGGSGMVSRLGRKQTHQSNGKTRSNPQFFFSKEAERWEKAMREGEFESKRYGLTRYGLSFYSLSHHNSFSLLRFFPFPWIFTALSLSLSLPGACLVIPLIFSIVFWLYIDCLSCGLVGNDEFCLWVFRFSTKDGILVGEAIWVHMAVSFDQLKLIKNNNI